MTLASAMAAWVLSLFVAETCDYCAFRVIAPTAATQINSNTRPNLFITILIFFLRPPIGFCIFSCPSGTEFSNGPAKWFANLPADN